MNKCIFCGVELAPQSRFCGVCGKVQPSEPGNNDPGFIQTVIALSSSENPPLSTPPQPQQPYSDYLQPLPAPSSPQLPPAQYGHPQLSQQQQPYSGYQQPLPAPSSPQLPPAQYGHPQFAPNQAQWSGPQPAKRAGGIIPWIIVGILIIVILGGVGIWAIVPRPPSLKPTITVTSKYHDDASNPAGAKDTKIHIDGQQFANNSKITFLLDNNTVISDKQTESDDKGNLKTDLLITPNWSIGNHTLTAYDESKNTTSTGKSLTICDQGDCGTLGPNNAPPNNATFSFAVISDKLPDSFKLNVTGSSSSKGGSVCSNFDNGATWTASVGDSSYTMKSVYSCHGTYKGGKIVYSQTLEKRFYTDSNGKEICRMNSPHANYRQLNGQFTQNGTFEGKVIRDSTSKSEFTCVDNYYIDSANDSNGTWVSSQINTTNA